MSYDHYHLGLPVDSDEEPESAEDEYLARLEARVWEMEKDLPAKNTTNPYGAEGVWD